MSCLRFSLSTDLRVQYSIVGSMAYAPLVATAAAASFGGPLQAMTKLATAGWHASPTRRRSRAATNGASHWRKTRVRRTVAKWASRQHADWKASAVHSAGPVGTRTRTGPFGRIPWLPSRGGGCTRSMPLESTCGRARGGPSDRGQAPQNFGSLELRRALRCVNTTTEVSKERVPRAPHCTERERPERAAVG